ncbi:diguanylate cyclase domain-containing protein [Massilia glaciei]|uniref:GGDEF domain-containing protein n=1 Tax=Massilia glaciei TaxID=1524097 RepID=A0A2U2HH85_9BURK|nr:diguanylate cyclase [Massilia glaciei]PWF45026.1 GGDEF domain-containing protein [Massilia glaciei]
MENDQQDAAFVDLAGALELIGGFAAAATPEALIESALRATQHHAAGHKACVLRTAGQRYRLVAPEQADGAPSYLPPFAQLLLESGHAPGRCPTIREHGALGLPLTGPGGRHLGYLCCWQSGQSSLAPRQLHMLSLIAAALSASLAALSALARERRLLRQIIDNVPDQIYVKDAAGRFIIGNRAAAAGIGVDSPQQLEGRSDLEFFPIACRTRFHEDEQGIIGTGEAIVDQIEESINRAGLRRWYSTTKVPLLDDAGRVHGIVGLSRDVTTRMSSDEAIRLRNRALEASNDAVIITGCREPDYPVSFINPAFERMTGFTPEQARQRSLAALLGLEIGNPSSAGLLEALREQREGRAVLRCPRKDGGVFWSDIRMAPVRDAGGVVSHYVFTISDISKARDTEQQLERLASLDMLTGLPNRRLLLDRLTQALAMGERGGFVVGVAFIDLDRLKHVNDTHGHDAGDAVLRAVGQRVLACVRKCDTVGRLGGDEFVLVSLHNTKASGKQAAAQEGGGLVYITRMLEKIQGKVAQPVAVGGLDLSATCSIGMSLFPRDGKDAETLLRHAENAMNVAKKNGRNKIEFNPEP